MKYNLFNIKNSIWVIHKLPQTLRQTMMVMLSMIVYLFFGNSAKAQDTPCGTDDCTVLTMGWSPQYALSKAQAEQDYIESIGQFSRAENLYVIPCVVHVFYHNEETELSISRVQHAIEILNEQLSTANFGDDIDIRVELARIDPDGQCTNGITYHYLAQSSVSTSLDFCAGPCPNNSQFCCDPDGDYIVNNAISHTGLCSIAQWPAGQYLNLYTIENIDGPSIAYNRMTPGFTQDSYFWPGPGTIAASAIDAIVCESWFFGLDWTDCQNVDGQIFKNNEKILAHEFGHYLGLCHTWSCADIDNDNNYDNCHPNSEGLTNGDLIEDTPPMNDQSVSCMDWNCTTGSNSCSLDDPNLNDPQWSYMSYSFHCQDYFSTGQADRMYYTLDNNTLRQNLYTCANLTATGLGYLNDCGGANLVASITAGSGASCAGNCTGQASVCVGGGSGEYSFMWSSGETTQSAQGLCAGNNSVVVNDGINTPVMLSVSIESNGNDYPDDITITSQAQLNNLFTGSNSISFGGDITISGGGTYLLQDKTFVLSTGSEIYINQPASIEFRNCDFIPCGGWWNGFRVKSDPGPDNLAFNDVRGILIFSENSNGGCYIEGAGSAIQTVGTWGQNGIYKSSGRIQATKAHFYNCLNSFDIRNGTDKGSFFKGCTFDVDTDLQIKFPGSNFSRHMYYSRTFGYHVYGCTFTNSNQLVSGWGDRRYGIYAYNSPVRVSGWDIDLNGEIQAQERSTFEGFNCGFRAYVNNGTYNGLVVKDSEFHQNKYAIYCNNACFHYLNRNEIHVGEPTGLAPLDDATGAYAGIYQYGGAQFEIMENDITGYITTEPDLSGPSSAFSVGICISRTKTADDEVYKNYLHNLNFGNLANGDNNEDMGDNGLRYVCNENTGNHYDFAVSDNIMLASVADIAEVQTDFGESLDDPEESAANKFFSTADDANIQYQNFWNVGETETIEYRRYFLGANETPTTDDYLGIEITAAGNNFCASETHKMVLIDGSINQTELSNWSAREEASRNNWQSSLYLWKALIDGGNTEELQEEIDFAWTQDTWTMRAQLLAKSPYLSRDILYGVADKTIVFPHPIALEIFLANPDVLRDNRFIKHLQTKVDPMPEYMIDLLLASRDQATFRTMLENNLGKHRSIYIEAAGKVLRTHLQDENYNLALFPNELKALKTFNTELLVVEDYLQQGNATEARNRYDDIPAICELTRYEMEEWAAYGLWLEVREEMVLQGKDYDALSTTEVTAITNIAELHWNSYAGRYAQEILNEYYAGEYEIEPMVSVGSGGPKSSRIASNDVASLLYVYPNPTSDYIIVQLSMPTFIGKHQLVVTDASGKLVHQVVITNAQQQLAIDVQQWSSGNYQVVVMKEQSVIETKGINVVR